MTPESTSIAANPLEDLELPDFVPTQSSPFTSNEMESFETRFGRVSVVKKGKWVDQQLFEKSFSHLCMDHRHYQITEQTLPQDFDYRYLVLEDPEGRVRAVQPFFLVHQDIMAGLPPSFQFITNAIRRLFPNFLKLKTLMVGCTVGQGHLGAHSDPDRFWLAEALHEALGIYASQCKTSIIVLKDFPSSYRSNLAPFSNNGYVRIPSFPAVKLELDFPDFEQYMATHLSKVTRKSLRRKFKKASSCPPIEMTRITDIEAIIDEIYPLYLAVFERSDFRFEKLTKNYFCEIGKQMPDRTRFFIWKQSGKIIAFNLCFLHNNQLQDCCLGLDYSVALDLHLYFITWRDVIQWSLKNNIKTYYSAPLNYDSKLHFRCELAPLDLYVCHTSNWINPFFRKALKFLEPTRHDPILRRFKNACEL